MLFRTIGFFSVAASQFEKREQRMYATVYPVVTLSFPLVIKMENKHSVKVLSVIFLVEMNLSCHHIEKYREITRTIVVRDLQKVYMGVRVFNSNYNFLR